MRRHVTLAALLFCALFIAGTAALAADQIQLKAEKYVLPNGLQVILHEDHSIPVVSVNVWYHVGSKNEKPGRTGFAHLFEHMMFQGSKHFDGDYFLPLEKIGAEVNGSTTEDRTNYFEDIPSEQLELALAMESDRMGYLPDVLTQEKLSNQQDVVKNERRQGVENAPYGIENDITPELMYPMGHPYSWSVIGSLRDLTAASLDDVKEFFRQYYTPNNASLCIAGDFDPAQAKQLVEKYFASLPPGPPIARYEMWLPEITQVRRAVAEDEVELPRVYMMWHSPGYYTPGDAELDLFADALSNGMNARLNASLVYKMQIAQDVNAFQSSKEMGSLFTIVATAKPGHTAEELEAAIDVELTKILRDGITPRELTRGKTHREATFVRRIQQVGFFGGRADLLNEYNTLLGSPDKLAWDMARYQDATVEGVMKVARTYLDFNKRGILYIVPQGKVVAAAETVDRTVTPQAGTVRDFTPPTIQTADLSNGIKILLVEDHRLPLVDAQLIIERGWAADPAGKFGLAALTADLLNEGTKKLDALQIADTVRMLGAQLNTGSDYDCSYVAVNSLKRNLAPALGLVADVLLNPTFPQAELDRLKKNRLARIEQSKSEPWSAAYRNFRETIFGVTSPYGQPPEGTGTEQTLTAISRDDIVNFYGQNYFPNEATLAIAGDITLAEAKAIAEKIFAGWKQGTPAPIPAPELITLTAPKVLIIDRPGAQQSMIMAGHPCMAPNDADYSAFQVMNQMLGGLFISRINMNLREDKGYTYGSRGYLDLGNYLSSYIVAAPVHTQYTKESVAEILKELREIGTTRPLTDDELANSKVAMLKSFPQGFQDLGGVTGQLRSIALFDRPLDWWQNMRQRVEGVDQTAVKGAVTRKIHPNEILIVIVGDRAKIEPGLQELGLGTIEHL